MLIYFYLREFANRPFSLQKQNTFPGLPDMIKERLDFIVNAQMPPPYGEVDSLIITSLRSDAKVLSQVCLIYIIL